MAKVPLFFRDRQHRDHFAARLKLTHCPRCSRDGFLIRNGRLMGNDAQDQKDGRIERGQRFLCSNRFKRGGCGRSFSILHRDILRNFSFNAAVVFAFLAACLEHRRVHAAWETLTSKLSLSSAYRLWQRFGREQDRLRHLLSRLAPSPSSGSSEPRFQTLAHLQAAFPEDDFSTVAAFQGDFQTSFFI